MVENNVIMIKNGRHPLQVCVVERRAGGGAESAKAHTAFQLVASSTQGTTPGGRFKFVGYRYVRRDPRVGGFPTVLAAPRNVAVSLRRGSGHEFEGLWFVHGTVTISGRASLTGNVRRRLNAVPEGPTRLHPE